MVKGCVLTSASTGIDVWIFTQDIVSIWWYLSESWIQAQIVNLLFIATKKIDHISEDFFSIKVCYFWVIFQIFQDNSRRQNVRDNPLCVIKSTLFFNRSKFDHQVFFIVIWMINHRWIFQSTGWICFITCWYAAYFTLLRATAVLWFPSLTLKSRLVSPLKTSVHSRQGIL